MKLFARAFVLLPTVLVMAKESTLIDISPVVTDYADPVCNGVVASLAVFGIHVDANVCLDVSITELISHLPIPSIKTCAEAVAAASILGTEADVDVCLATGSHNQENSEILKKRHDIVDAIHKKPVAQPSTPPAQPPVHPDQLPTPISPRHSKSCEAIIAKIHTLCGANIDVSICLNLGINIDLLRLDRLKC
ncbi:hypothetical protein K7432_013915, partial [Basidiobolus ranarum]